jgi:hypothetical protein
MFEICDVFYNKIGLVAKLGMSDSEIGLDCLSCYDEVLSVAFNLVEVDETAERGSGISYIQGGERPPQSRKQKYREQR